MADTLMYVKKLEDAGFSRKQAEAQVEMMRDYSNETLATKHDLSDLKSELKHEINEVQQQVRSLETRMHQEFKLVRTEMSQIGDKITLRLGGMMVLCMGILAAYLKMG